jgi:hypothetical protein
MTTETIKITEREKEMFDYLNDLRNSGATNMFGAGSWLENVFNITPREARRVLSLWMGNFNEDGYEHLL